MGKRIITEAAILEAMGRGEKTLRLDPRECIVTPKAWDCAEEGGLTIALLGSDASPGGQLPASVQSAASGAGSPASPQAAATAPVAQNRTESLVRQVSELIAGRLPAGSQAGEVEKLVREVVQARLAGAVAPQQPTPQASPSPEAAGSGASAEGVRLVDGQRLMDSGAGPAPLPGSAILAEAIGAGEGAKLAGGFMRWSKASFKREVEIPEMNIVIDGLLHLTVGGQTIIAKPGDMVYLPKGVRAIYSSPSDVWLACVNCVQ